MDVNVLWSVCFSRLEKDTKQKGILSKDARSVSPTFKTEVVLTVLLSSSCPHHQPDEYEDLKVHWYQYIAIYRPVIDVLLLPPHNNTEALCHPLLHGKIKGWLYVHAAEPQLTAHHLKCNVHSIQPHNPPKTQHQTRGGATPGDYETTDDFHCQSQLLMNLLLNQSCHFIGWWLLIHSLWHK